MQSERWLAWKCEQWCEKCVKKRRQAAVIVNRKTVSQIIEEVSAKYGVPVYFIKSKRRTRNLTQPRFEICWRAKRETNASLPKIGKLLNRDHTSILHAIRKYKSWQQMAIGKAEIPTSDKNVDFDMIIRPRASQ